MYTCQRCHQDSKDPAALSLVRNVETGRKHWLCLPCRQAVRQQDRLTEGPELPNWQPAWRRAAG